MTLGKMPYILSTRDKAEDKAESDNDLPQPLWPHPVELTHRALIVNIEC